MEHDPAAVVPDTGTTSIDKAIDLLFHMGSNPRPQGVSEIGRALGLPKSSAHRLLATLKRRELVEQDEAGRYRAGSALLSLAGAMPLLSAARPALEQGASSLGETFFLVAARDLALVVLDKVESNGLLRGSPAVGGIVPVHATAVGKLYLAYSAASIQLERPLPRYTQHTITSAGRLAREVRLARKSGSALSHGEWIDGLSVAAAPILLGERMVGAVCVAVPSVKLPQLGERVISEVLQAATSIGARLRGPT